MLWKRRKMKNWWIFLEREKIKMQMVENRIRDNYRFILLARASHFRSVCKTASIP
jgi:hypothetical protein